MGWSNWPRGMPCRSSPSNCTRATTVAMWLNPCVTTDGAEGILGTQNLDWMEQGFAVFWDRHKQTSWVGHCWCTDNCSSNWGLGPLFGGWGTSMLQVKHTQSKQIVTTSYFIRLIVVHAETVRCGGNFVVPLSFSQHRDSRLAVNAVATQYMVDTSLAPTRTWFHEVFVLGLMTTHFMPGMVDNNTKKGCDTVLWKWTRISVWWYWTVVRL